MDPNEVEDMVKKKNCFLFWEHLINKEGAGVSPKRGLNGGWEGLGQCQKYWALCELKSTRQALFFLLLLEEFFCPKE